MCKAKKLKHLSIEEVDDGEKNPQSANYVCKKCKRAFLMVDCGDYDLSGL